MAPQQPRLVNTVRIKKSSETGKILIWFKELQETKDKVPSRTTWFGAGFVSGLLIALVSFFSGKK